MIVEIVPNIHTATSVERVTHTGVIIGVLICTKVFHILKGSATIEIVAIVIIIVVVIVSSHAHLVIIQIFETVMSACGKWRILTNIIRTSSINISTEPTTTRRIDVLVSTRHHLHTTAPI